MDRRTFLAVATGALVMRIGAEAQQPGRVYRIGVLLWSPRAAHEDRGELEALREELRGLGWVEGGNLHIEYRSAERQAERLSPLLAELDGLGLDLIVAVTTTVTSAAAQVIKSIPIVFTVVSDPVASGIIASLARPGGNLTGFGGLAPEIAAKNLELLKEAVPTMSRVAVLWGPTNPGVALAFRHARDVAPALGVTVQSLQVRRRDDFDSAFATMTRERPDALSVVLAPITVRHVDRIVEFARQKRLPTSMGWSGFAQAGGLISYNEDFLDNFRHAARYVHRILNGARPADLPVERPTNFVLKVNLETAGAIGLTIPPSLLLRANQVIK